MSTDPLVVADAIRAAALSGGRIIRESFGSRASAGVEEKTSFSDLVTTVDHRVNEHVVELLTALLPDFAIISEESADVPGNAQALYVDPIDGTMNFIHGFREIAVSIGYWNDGRAAAGVVYNPITDELFSAVAGYGAQRNGVPIHASSVKGLEESLVASGWPYAKDRVENAAAVMGRMCLTTREVRTIGSAALAACYVGAGVFDGFWEWGLEPWDLAAGMLIAREAGAIATDADGSEFSLARANIAVAGPRIHGALVDVVNSQTGPESSRGQYWMGTDTRRHKT